MRTTLKLGSVGLISILSAGCSIYPLPEQVAGLDTYDIVKQIRCETRDSIENYAIGYIEQVDLALAEEFKSGRRNLATIKREELPLQARDMFEKYDQSAVAYDFTFDIKEANNNSVDVGFAKVLSRGPFNLGLTASKDLSRQNTRNFRISDTFEGLLTQLPENYCTGVSGNPNFAYPITGRIGIDKLTSAFLDLNQSGKLAPEKGGKVPVIADTIEFTTKIGGNVNPTIELSPVGDHFQFVSAGITSDNSRLDKHRVVIAMSLPPDPVPAKGTKGSSSTAKAGAERRALKELERQDDRALRLQFRRLDQRLEELSE